MAYVVSPRRHHGLSVLLLLPLFFRVDTKPEPLARRRRHNGF
jgi:hypothetical protein